MTKILFHLVDKKGAFFDFKFGESGNFEVFSNFGIQSTEDMRLIFEQMDRFIGLYFSTSFLRESKKGTYIRFTNDREEFEKIQDGTYTKSVNHVGNFLERGISVSNDMSYIALGTYDYFYIVSGNVIGFGSDGEPLIDADTMKKHSAYRRIGNFSKRAEIEKKKRADLFLKKYRWTEEQLRDLEYESVSHRCKIEFITPDGRVEEYSRWGNNEQKLEEYLTQ